VHNIQAQYDTVCYLGEKDTQHSQAWISLTHSVDKRKVPTLWDTSEKSGITMN